MSRDVYEATRGRTEYAKARDHQAIATVLATEMARIRSCPRNWSLKSRLTV